ncbi:MAG: type II toxin-antitoxin system VapC family toxin [Candidatus Dormibacteraceae bacterium]
MKLLLDTHAATWFLEADPRLSGNARAAIGDGGNQVLLSAVVVWEIAIKRALGKLPVDHRYLPLLLDSGVEPLAITLDHARAVEELPLHHRDPFDRLLVAQAKAEDATIVTSDLRIAAYGVPVLW